MAKKTPPSQPPGDNGDKKDDKVVDLDQFSKDKESRGEEDQVRAKLVVNKTKDDKTDKAKQIGKAMGEAFSRMIEADMRGEDYDENMDLALDADQFRSDVLPEVSAAIARLKLQKGMADGFSVKMHPLGFLFLGDQFGGNQEVNESYRGLTRLARYKFYNRARHSLMQAQEESAEPIEIERRLRRVDSEMRQLDQTTREELLFNFTEGLLCYEHGHDAYHYGFSTESFLPLKDESRQELVQLAMRYARLWHDAKVMIDTWERITQRFNESTLSHLEDIDADTVYRDTAYSPRSTLVDRARLINADTYYLCVQLTKALSAALPTSFAKDVADVMSKEFHTDLEVSASDAKEYYSEPSRYLRQAFLALTQGNGTFENLATAILRFEDVVTRQLNARMSAARYMVNLYDALGLCIVDVLKGSHERILEEPPF